MQEWIYDHPKEGELLLNSCSIITEHVGKRSVRKVTASSIKAVCILGMHRSGTSMVSRSLNLLGVNLGDEKKLVGGGKHNQKGFWEYRKITKTQESLLRTFNHGWNIPKRLPRKWWNKQEIEPYRVKLKEIIESDFKGNELWGWKDPRNSLTIPLWKQILAELNINRSYLIVVRNPLDVVKSLETRNGFPHALSFKLWGLYTLSALLDTAKENRAIIIYDDFLNNWENELKVVSRRLTIPWPEEESKFQNEMKDFVTEDLQHSKSDLSDLENGDGIPLWVVETFRLIKKAKESEEFLDSDKFTKKLKVIYNKHF